MLGEIYTQCLAISGGKENVGQLESAVLYGPGKITDDIRPLSYWEEQVKEEGAGRAHAWTLHGTRAQALERFRQAQDANENLLVSHGFLVGTDQVSTNDTRI